MKKNLATSLLLFGLLGSQSVFSETDAEETCLNNRQTSDDDCGSCEEEDDNGECTPRSLIFNGRLRYHHIATDYTSTGTGSSSCGSCSGAPSKFDLPSLKIQRQFVSRISRHDSPEFGQKVSLKDYSRRVINTGTDRLIYLSYDKNIPQRGLVYSPDRQCWIDNYTRTIFGCFLYNEAGVLITDKSLRDTAARAVVIHHDGTTEHYEYFYHPTAEGERIGGKARLASLMDRRGNSTDITYQDTIPADRVTPNALAFTRIDKVTDAYGRQASFSYHPAIANRYHYIKDITLPNGETVNYELGSLPGIGNNTLAKVTHPDGTESTFSSTINSDGLAELKVKDATADGAYSRNKTTYLATTVGFNSSGESVATVEGMIRRVDNGEGEMSYANRVVASGDQLLFEGGNKVTRTGYAIQGGINKRSYLPPVIVTNAEGSETESYAWQGDFFGFDAEAPSYLTFMDLIKHGYTYQTGHTTDSQGRGITTPRNPVSQKTVASVHADGTSATYPKNQFLQPLLQTDRVGREINNIYDAQGNILSKTRGFGSDVETTETNIYNLRGQVIESRDALYDANHEDLHNTRYEYDSNGYMVKKIESADFAGGSRPETLYSYDFAGRLQSTTDPLGRVVTYEYDSRSRLVKTTYNDTSFEEITYGTETDNANLVTQMRDRNGILTTYKYDAVGRKIETRVAAGLPEESLEICNYLSGTLLKLNCTINGETRSFHYDYANRLVRSTVQANANTALVTSKEIDESGRLRSTTDAYGRTTYFLYDHNDRISKTVMETVPGGAGGAGEVPAYESNKEQTHTEHNYTLTTLTGETLETNPDSDNRTHTSTYTDARDLFIQALARDLGDNAKYLVRETIYDSEGQALISIDARGIKTWNEYDSLGRSTRTIVAVGTPSEIRSEQDYDVNSNVVETRSPRYFTEGTLPTLTGVGKDQYTYNGRNMRASHTTAVGSTEEQTQSWFYLADGRADTHTDYRGNIAKTLWHICCGRLQASIQRDGSSTTISNTDYKGQVTHTAVVSDVPALDAFHDPINAQTLSETTTRFDGRGRPTHTTLWLEPLDSVDDDARVSLGDTTGIPIAGLDGVPAEKGLTSTYSYDEDLTDGEGVDVEYASQISELTTRYGYNPFGSGANGYATKMTNPAGEVTVSISDGAGRTILSINPEGDIMTYHFDELVNEANLWAVTQTVPNQGTLLQTRFIDALGNQNATFSDGAGRTVARKDAENNISGMAYNANGSVVKTRDANGLGENCTFDALNRDISCTDLQELAEGKSRTSTYNAASQKVTSTNADDETTTNVYDVRNRLKSSTDANQITTSYTYDANNNLRTLTDGNGNDNQWIYDARNLKVTKIYPGNAGNDFYRVGYDALGRVAIKVDQIGTSCTNVYDLAGRMIEKQYHTGATPALGGVVTAGASMESTDTFTFDRASRVIATHKGRHDITTEHSYALDSQPLSETIKANGDTYTSSRTYDAANRPLSHTFPNGKTTQWSYTARNLVSTVRYEDELIATNTYDAGLRQTNQNYGNGLNRVITYARQDNLRSTDRVLTKDDLNFSYTYAVDKQVTAESIVADQVEDTSFTASYDAGNRLTAWNRAGADENHSQTWDYDDAGNWNSTTKDGDTEGRTHSVSNQITQLDGKAVSHDLKGNLTDYEYDRTDYRVKYDLDNRIVEVKADSETIRYRYDALGRRIISKGDDETILIWWGDSECAEYEHRASKDAIQNDIMGHPTRLNSVIARDTEDRENRIELQWYHKNYLDHVYAVSDDDGNLIEHYRYTAFGEPEIYSATGAKRNTSAIANTVMWNTRRYDADNGLYYYKYRHFAANIGRWLGRDPIEEEGGNNLYMFVYNDSINKFDELGMHTLSVGVFAVYYRDDRFGDVLWSGGTPYPTTTGFEYNEGWSINHHVVYDCDENSVINVHALGSNDIDSKNIIRMFGYRKHTYKGRKSRNNYYTHEDERWSNVVSYNTSVSLQGDSAIVKIGGKIKGASSSDSWSLDVSIPSVPIGGGVGVGLKPTSGNKFKPVNKDYFQWGRTYKISCDCDNPEVEIIHQGQAKTSGRFTLGGFAE